MEVDTLQYSIIVVDDNHSIQRYIEALLLQMDGVQIVGMADTVGEARALIGRHRPDALLLDITLPDGNGIDLLKTVKQSYPRTTVIMLTNHANPYYRRACERGGVDYFFDKATEFMNAMETVERLARSAESPV